MSGWIEWTGGPTPQGRGQRRTRNYESPVESFDDDDWGSDIIAYRIVPDVPALTDGEGPDVDALAQEIRRVDGNHDLGAGALAEALMPFLEAQASAYKERVEALEKALKHVRSCLAPPGRFGGVTSFIDEALLNGADR